LFVVLVLYCVITALGISF